MTIDTEEEWDWGSGWPTAGYTLENIRRVPKFQELCSRYGVATTYFVNKAVLDDKAGCEILAAVSRLDRVEIGMHIHPWNTPPFDSNVAVQSRDTFLRNLPEASIFDKLENVYNTSILHGFHPVSFRGGRYSTGGPIHRFLRGKGFLADASVVPFTKWQDTGAPDYTERGLEPRRLPPEQEGDKPLWEIPLTLGFTRRPFTFWRSFYSCVENTFLRKLRLIGVLERLGAVHKVWLNFEEPMGEHMLGFLKLLRKLRLPCICFTVHSSSLMAGGSPYTRTEREERRLFEQVEEIFAALSGWPDFQPATVAEIARKLEDDHHACTRD